MYGMGMCDMYGMGGYGMGGCGMGSGMVNSLGNILVLGTVAYGLCKGYQAMNSGGHSINPGQPNKDEFNKANSEVQAE